MQLPFDIITHVLEIYRDEYDMLFRCSLVNTEFNRAASRLLYAHIVVSPPFRPVLNLRDDRTLSEGSNFASASSPRIAPNVVELEIRGAYPGYLSPRAPPRNSLPQLLLSGILNFKNLQKITLTPMTFHEDLFSDILVALKSLPALCDVTVNASCTDEIRAPLLASLSGLSKLTIHDPTRAILQILPGWLERLSPSLVELHLKDNCGSVTPGVLQSFLAPVQANLQAFTLGLSYSITDEHIFSFLSQLPSFSNAQLRYYWQMGTPAHLPAFHALKHFSAHHQCLSTKFEVNSFCKWIRRTISSSPVETLVVECEDDEDEVDTNLNFAFDSLGDHLIKKHASTLLILDLRSSFLGADILAGILTQCTLLQKFCLCAGKNALGVFSKHATGLQWLHTVSFNLRNVKRSKFQITNSTASEVFQNSGPSLRRLYVNGMKWEGEWTCTANDGVKFVIREVHGRKAPWEKL